VARLNNTIFDCFLIISKCIAIFNFIANSKFVCSTSSARHEINSQTSLYAIFYTKKSLFVNKVAYAWHAMIFDNTNNFFAVLGC
jgi:hypothetical protein